LQADNFTIALLTTTTQGDRKIHPDLVDRFREEMKTNEVPSRDASTSYAARQEVDVQNQVDGKQVQ